MQWGETGQLKVRSDAVELLLPLRSVRLDELLACLVELIGRGFEVCPVLMIR